MTLHPLLAACLTPTQAAQELAWEAHKREGLARSILSEHDFLVRRLRCKSLRIKFGDRFADDVIARMEHAAARKRVG